MIHPEAWLANTVEQVCEIPTYPVMRREGAPPPYVVYARESTQDDLTLDQTYGDTGACTATFSLEVFADSYLQAKDIAAAIRGAIRNFSGEADGLTIIKTTAEDDRDGTPVMLDGRDVPTYTIEQTYTISWSLS